MQFSLLYSCSISQRGFGERFGQLLTGCSDSPVPFLPLVKPFRALQWVYKTRFHKTRFRKTRVPGTKTVLTRPWHVTAVWALAPNYIWKSFVRLLS